MPIESRHNIFRKIATGVYLYNINIQSFVFITCQKQNMYL